MSSFEELVMNLLRQSIAGVVEALSFKYKLFALADGSEN
jgi:hypothetical protein